MDVKLNVELLEYTPYPEKVVAMAARLCYSPKGISELKESISDDKAKEMVYKLINLGHMSPFEHVSFTFGVEGISRVTTHELVRHRIASYSQQSQRYISEKGQFSYTMPPSIEKDSNLKAKYEDFMKKSQELYTEFISNGIHKEDARYILPNAKEAKIVISMNARALMHFFNLRCCDRAQLEIRKMAWRMLEIIKKVAPNIFAKGGASCDTFGYCTEGDMSCGRAKQININ